MNGKIVEEGTTTHLIEKYEASSVDDLLIGVINAKDDQLRPTVLSFTILKLALPIFNILIENRYCNNCIVLFKVGKSRNISQHRKSYYA